MCFGPPDLAFVFDLPGYGQVGKMAVMLRNVYDVICEKQAAMVRTSHLTKSLIIGGPPSKQSQSNERLLSRKKNRISHLLHEEWDSHKKTSTKGLSPAPPRKGTRVLDDEPEKEPPRKFGSRLSYPNKNGVEIDEQKWEIRLYFNLVSSAV
ncbi:Ras family [Musa troglodytarum]|uniref:Ras family n=1 Tax=Musa troglodytarum TaxID=320322 RepID=A0A9E7G6M3_9LILI|nr:Ras family [Musa troglodytarum]